MSLTIIEGKYYRVHNYEPNEKHGHSAVVKGPMINSETYFETHFFCQSEIKLKCQEHSLKDFRVKRLFSLNIGEF